MQNLKLTFPFIIVFHYFSFAQNDNPNLKFETPYYNAVDQWVALSPNDKDSTYTLGFIYIDEMAGFTFNYEGTFESYSDNTLINKSEKTENSLVKSRLSKNSRPVAILNKAQLKQLKLPIAPDWLGIYKSNAASVNYLKQMGYFYNHVGASQNALDPLLEAYQIEPHFEGLEFELAFAYNATGQFEKAIPILTNALENNDSDQLLHKELLFAYINSKQFEKAEAAVETGISKANDDSIKAEMAINMCSMFLHLKDRERYNKWEKITKSYINGSSQYDPYFKYFESEWEKEE